jgi:hypothetical protein
MLNAEMVLTRNPGYKFVMYIKLEMEDSFADAVLQGTG